MIVRRGLVALLFALAVGAWFTVGPGAGPPIGGCAPAAALQASSGQPALATDPPSVRWEAGTLPVGDELIVHDVADFDGGFVAVGRESGGPESHAFVLRSVDGITWEGRPDDELRFADAAMEALIPVGDRLFALGSVSTNDSGGSRAAVWISSDGLAWREARGPFDDASVSSLAAGADGMVLIGSSNADGVLRAWRSEIGEAWEVTPLDLPVPLDGAHLGLIAVGGDGWISVGSVSRGSGSPAVPVAWRSGDGVTWSCQILDAGGFPVAQPHQLHRSGSGWLAVGDAGQVCGFGGSCPGSTLGWVSDDGLTWSPAILDKEPMNSGGTAYAGSEAGFVGVGHGGTWVSDDGAAWVRVPDGGTGAVLVGQADALVLTDDGRIVAAGTSWFAVGELSP